jgi:hypothetical protein
MHYLSAYMQATRADADTLLRNTHMTTSRYLVRAHASDGAGGWASADVTLLVRKAGDVMGRAPCCRTTGQIIVQSLGRPIDAAEFRPVWLNASAIAAGWDPSYLSGGPEDLEAERLFDFTLLAPIDTGMESEWLRVVCSLVWLRSCAVACHVQARAVTAPNESPGRC